LHFFFAVCLLSSGGRAHDLLWNIRTEVTNVF